MTLHMNGKRNMSVKYHKNDLYIKTQNSVVYNSDVFFIDETYMYKSSPFVKVNGQWYLADKEPPPKKFYKIEKKKNHLVIKYQVECPNHLF